MKYRHEYKYILSPAEAALTEHRVRGLLRPDSHMPAAAHGYRVRSLYFDDRYDGCLADNVNGIDPREKFRIRMYNGDSSFLRLECKRKERGKTLKLSCPLAAETAARLIGGDAPAAWEEMPALVRKLVLQMRTRGLKSAVIVDYDRRAFVFPGGNVRITFDSGISSAPYCGEFFRPTLPERPILPGGQQVLEVKFDELLPGFLQTGLQLDTLRQCSLSKYAMCRKYSLREDIRL